MPGGDRTGPIGRGPRSGRSAGFCVGYEGSGISNRGHRQEGARGGRGGRGHCNRFLATGAPGWRYFAGNPTPGGMSFSAQTGTPEDELDALKGQARYLESSLKELQVRMEALASRNKTE